MSVVREKPLCKHSSGCCKCNVGSQQVQNTGPTYVRDNGGITAQRKRKRLVAAGVHTLGQCVCPCMLSFTQSLTLHPLTKLRSRQCVQMIQWFYFKYTWEDQGHVNSGGLCNVFHTVLCVLSKCFFIYSWQKPRTSVCGLPVTKDITLSFVSNSLVPVPTYSATFIQKRTCLL